LAGRAELLRAASGRFDPLARVARRDMELRRRDWVAMVMRDIFKLSRRGAQYILGQTLRP